MGQVARSERATIRVGMALLQPVNGTGGTAAPVLLSSLVQRFVDGLESTRSPCVEQSSLPYTLGSVHSAIK